MRDPVHDVRGLLRAEPQLPEDGARLLRPPRNHLRRRGRRGHARLLLQVRSKARTDRDTRFGQTWIEADFWLCIWFGEPILRYL